ncbi:MAG: hypothetical protein KW788_01725 [Candidatus Doudnabacteria bacterium]|nr:hypothetical protein [Candidatus Doudnabacteria bacterium]
MDYETCAFEFPDDVKTRIEIVNQIPNDWSWVDGQLQALGLVQSVCRGSALKVSRFHSIHPTIANMNRNEDDKIQRDRDREIFENIYLNRQLPEFILFDEAGFSQPLTLEFAKKIATHFLQLGYNQGNLEFFRGYRNDNKFDNAVRCQILLNDWTPPAVVVRWQPHGKAIAKSLIDSFSSKLNPLQVAIPV